ncbi:DNA-directed RNA polymerase subunit omega [Panacagrimonas sp.]|uniref:DNA-directed RNA polymerase subunit omega n=1 Tax=Panacagrimonas sp. TaxID=2480088 RepID=UPI003B52BEA6
MARAMLEDCLHRIPSHFELCAIAAKRARQLARGAPSQFAVGVHKATVLSLLEIADGHIDRSVMDESDLPVPSPDNPGMRLDDLDPLADA